MNSTIGLHAPCQAATAKLLRHLPLCNAPVARRDSNQSVAINHPLPAQKRNRGDMPLACPVETDANRPLFMQLVGEIYTAPLRLGVDLHNPPQRRYSVGFAIE
jgi:hypothetical protein